MIIMFQNTTQLTFNIEPNIGFVYPGATVQLKFPEDECSGNFVYLLTITKNSDKSIRIKQIQHTQRICIEYEFCGHVYRTYDLERMNELVWY